MRKTSKIMSLAAVTLLSASVLAACGAKSSKSSSSAEQANLSFPGEVTNDGAAIKGGQFKYAIVAASSSTGLLIDELTNTTVDSTFGVLVDEGMFGYDGERKLDDSGLAKVDFDLKAKTITVSLTGKDYKWSDGESFTIDDYIFTIEKMADKGYTGVRFDDGFKNIIGMEEFAAGKADSISGLEKVDDYTVVLHVKEMSPSMMYAGGDVPSYVTPKHIFKDIPVADWEKSEYARANSKFVGMGAFKIKEVVSGESVTFVPNEYYYKGKVGLDSLKMDIVSPDTIVSEMKAGHYDYAEMPTDQLDTFKNASNITVLGTLASAYEYLSFNLGKYDADAGKNVMNPDAKMNDVKLRQAMGYALDTKTAGDKLYNGLYHPANSLVISFFGDLHDADLKGYTYDPDKAKALLDEAGYKDVDGDGIREDKNGKPFKISLAARKRTEANEALIQQYQNWWKEVGLNVELYTGRTMELNSFYDTIEVNDANIDAYLAGWSTGYDPNPTGLWGPEAKFNYSRYVSDENTKLLQALGSEASFDEKKNIENYKKWQENAEKEAFAIPLFESEKLIAINKRVKYFDTKYGSASKAQWTKVELTAEAGIAEK